MDYQWRQALDSAIARNRRDAHNRYLQLATLDLQQRPAVRTVVFRGFLEPDRLSIVTDTRSDKYEQLVHNNLAEVCWYFTRSREQFRLRGPMEIIDARSALAEARRESWSRLSEGAREQFYWTSPGQALGSGEVPAAGDDGIPESFLLLALTPERVDHLRLAGSPQQRMISTHQDGDWRVEAVNP